MTDRGFITYQDQSRFCEKTSENHVQDNKVAKNHTKTLDNWIIYQFNIFETDFRFGKTTLFNISTEFLPLSSVQSNRAVFFF
jgi:hypothetical protein